MTKLELAKKTLEEIGDKSFDIRVYASDGGKCSDGWCDYMPLDLSSEEILYLLKQGIRKDELFEDLTIKKFDSEAACYDMVMEAAWPDGGPAASVNDVIPDELTELSEELESVDETDNEAVMAIREKLKQITDGKYTFHFTVEAGDYEFANDANEAIALTANEALGLLHGRYGKNKVFEGICKKSFDEELINKKAKELDFADNYDSFSYGWDSDQLDTYLYAWEHIIDSILSGDITEEDLDSWLEYFDDTENYEMQITDWYDWYKERED